ncbi:hypothetical protein YT1_0459 [Rhodococcus ruber]|nr:hypothetical protein YT1_0459 [Rhodococcus ruber]
MTRRRTKRSRESKPLHPLIFRRSVDGPGSITSVRPSREPSSPAMDPRSIPPR